MVPSFQQRTLQTCTAAHGAVTPRWGSDCSGEAAAGIDLQAVADSVVTCVAIKDRATWKPLSMAAARSSSRAMLAVLVSRVHGKQEIVSLRSRLSRL